MELQRWREARGIPLILEPERFPSDDPAATRLVIAAALQGKDALRLATGIRVCDLGARRTARPILRHRSCCAAGGVRIPWRCARWAFRRRTRRQLYAQYTQDALAAGVFGAPSFVLPSGEFFWGRGPAGTAGTGAEGAGPLSGWYCGNIPCRPNK